MLLKMSNGKQSGKSQFSISQPPTDMLSQLKMHEMVKCSKVLKKVGTLSYPVTSRYSAVATVW